MEWTADKVRRIQQLAVETMAVSLNETIKNVDNDNGDETELGELVKSPYLMEDEIVRKESIKYLDKFIQKLSPREQVVIRLRFGLDDGQPRTLEEIGKRFKVTRERARQVEEKALRKLRVLISTNQLKLIDF